MQKKACEQTLFRFLSPRRTGQLLYELHATVSRRVRQQGKQEKNFNKSVKIRTIKHRWFTCDKNYLQDTSGTSMRRQGWHTKVKNVMSDKRLFRA